MCVEDFPGIKKWYGFTENSSNNKLKIVEIISYCTKKKINDTVLIHSMFMLALKYFIIIQLPS